MAHAIAYDGFGVLASGIIAAATLLATLSAHDWIARARTVGIEFHILLLASASGAMMMAQANDLIVVFLGLEILSIGLYVLVAYDRHRSTSSEAALKYLLLGGFASALFIYGTALTYGGTGTTTLTGIAYFLSTNFILPVKNGWQPEQISTVIAFLVLRVVNLLPQPQVTVASVYSG